MELSALFAALLGVVTVTSPIWLPVLKSWIDRRISAGVEHSFHRQLEEYKHQLNLAADATRFDFQRRIADFNLFSAKRHESYAEMWKLLRSAQGRILDIERQSKDNYEYYDEHDVEQLLVRKKLPSGKRSEVLQVWKNDRSAGVELLNDVLGSLLKHEASAAFVEANNAFVADELYLSSEVTQAVQDVLYQLDTLRVSYHDPEEAKSVQAAVLRREVYDNLRQLKELMRRDLGRGDYVEANSDPHLTSR